MFRKKGQAALEFLTTYGWAFLVILVMIGALSYFGVLNPDSYIPEACNFGAVLSCSGSYGIEYEDTNLAEESVIKVDVTNMMNQPLSISYIGIKEKSQSAWINVTDEAVWATLSTGVEDITDDALGTQNSDQIVITHDETLITDEQVVALNPTAKKIYKFKIVYTLGTSSTINKVVEGSITTTPYVP